MVVEVVSLFMFILFGCFTLALSATFLALTLRYIIVNTASFFGEVDIFVVLGMTAFSLLLLAIACYTFVSYGFIINF